MLNLCAKTCSADKTPLRSVKLGMPILDGFWSSKFAAIFYQSLAFILWPWISQTG